MTYMPGTHIDLTYLNRKAVVSRPKKSTSEATKELWDIGTSFVFKTTPSGFKSAIQIPVLCA